MIYPEPVEEAIALLRPILLEKAGKRLNSRWLALRLLDADTSLLREMRTLLGPDFLEDKVLKKHLQKLWLCFPNIR